MGNKKLKDLLSEISLKSANEAKERLMEQYLLWKHLEEQTDDITLIGIRLR